MRLSAKTIAPLAVLATAVAITAVMVASRPTAQSQRPPLVVSPVQVIVAAPADAALWVQAQGIVEPRTESDLVIEVAGRVVWVSPDLASGGFFAEGDPLARIDPREYEVTLDGANASLSRARANLTHAQANLKRQQSMRERGASSRALLDDAIHEQAISHAGVREAEVAVKRAELDLERTEIRAPFAGRVREKHVDVGQFVSRGVAMARVYSTDYVELRLPIHSADLAHLELPVRLAVGEEDAPASPAPRVVISAEYGGRRFDWEGRVVRTEGALDPRTQMTHVVARVDDPYAREAKDGRPPLPIGLFVEASIEGRTAEAVYDVPRAALRRGQEILVVDAADRLRVRRVEVLRSERDRAFVSSGIAAGERIVVSPLEVATDGMEVRILPALESADPIEKVQSIAQPALAPAPVLGRDDPS